jgi:hypothetical protein
MQRFKTENFDLFINQMAILAVLADEHFCVEW